MTDWYERAFKALQLAGYGGECRLCLYFAMEHGLLINNME